MQLKRSVESGSWLQKNLAPESRGSDGQQSSIGPTLPTTNIAHCVPLFGSSLITVFEDSMHHNVNYQSILMPPFQGSLQGSTIVNQSKDQSKDLCTMWTPEFAETRA